MLEEAREEARGEAREEDKGPKKITIKAKPEAALPLDVTAARPKKKTKKTDFILPVYKGNKSYLVSNVVESELMIYDDSSRPWLTEEDPSYKCTLIKLIERSAEEMRQIKVLSIEPDRPFYYKVKIQKSAETIYHTTDSYEDLLGQLKRQEGLLKLTVIPTDRYSLYT